MSPYEAYAFVMPIPEGRDILLGMPWFKTVNPIIDWQLGIIRERFEKVTCRGGYRQGSPDRTNRRQLLHYLSSGYNGTTGNTKITSTAKLKRLLKLQEGEFAIYVRAVQTEKGQRQKQMTWETLKANPAYDICAKYKNTVFKEELPNQLPTEGIRCDTTSRSMT
jgi:hypothetical protein